MKYWPFIMLPALACFLSSCGEVQDPLLNISFTTLPSEKFDRFELKVSSIHFIDKIDEDGRANGGSMLQQWDGAPLSIDLENKQSFVIANDNHWSMNVEGMRLALFKLKLFKNESSVENVDLPYVSHVTLMDNVILENGKQYDIEFIFDLDELIYEENGMLFMDPSYTVEIREL